MERPIVYCLHGFLGLAKLWHEIPWSAQLDIRALDLWQSFHEIQPRTLQEWASCISLPEGSLYGVGYSLGGRLLAHVLQAKPNQFRGAVLVSTHPGLENEAERQARLRVDRAWAERFRQEPWESLIASWESQTALATSIALSVDERDFDRQCLAQVMEVASLGAQAPLRQILRQSPVPQLWLAGERDQKFVDLQREFPNRRVVADSGHRLPWDQPLEFSQLVENFVLSPSAIEEVSDG